MGKVTDQAFVTLATNDVYCLGALVLANSLKLVNTTRELVVIITPMVTPEMRNHLNSVYDVVVCVDVLESNDQANLALSRRPELGVTFTKINCWKLTQYKKCVFLDSDCLVIKNCDELFDREELSAVPDIGWPDCFNSGVFVYVPSLETYQKLLDLAVQQGSFDGGDQGLLNTFFSSWATKDIAKHLSFIYNMASSATYTYLPAYKRFMKDVKIIHFLGSIKPWNFKCDYSTGRVSIGGVDSYRANHIQLWWDVYMKHVHALLDTRYFRVRPNISESNSPYWTVVAQYQNIISQGPPCQHGAPDRPYIHKPHVYSGYTIENVKLRGDFHNVPHPQTPLSLLTPPPSPNYGPMLINDFTSDENIALSNQSLLELSNRGDVYDLPDAALLTPASDKSRLKRRNIYRHDLHLASYTLSPLFYPDLGCVNNYNIYEAPSNKRHHHHIHSKRHKSASMSIDLSRSGQSVLEKGALSFVETLQDEVLEPRRQRITTSDSENDSGFDARREIAFTPFTDPFNPNVSNQHYQIVTSYERTQKSKGPLKKRRRHKKSDGGRVEIVAFDTNEEQKSLLGTAPISSGSRSDPPPRTLSDKEHKDAWEGGHIDYMGTDAFENIQRHIESQVQSADMNTFLASWNGGGEKEIKSKIGNREGWESGQSNALYPDHYYKGFEFGAAQSSYVNANSPNPHPMPIISPTPGPINLMSPPKTGKETKKPIIKKSHQPNLESVPDEPDIHQFENVSTQPDSGKSDFFIGDNESGESNHRVTFSPTLTLYDRSADEGYITPKSSIVSQFVPMSEESAKTQPSQSPINPGPKIYGAHDDQAATVHPIQPDILNNYTDNIGFGSEPSVPQVEGQPNVGSQVISLKNPSTEFDFTRDIKGFAKTLQNTITGDALKENDNTANAAEAKNVQATAASNYVKTTADSHNSVIFSNALNQSADYDHGFFPSPSLQNEKQSTEHDLELPHTIIPLSPSISKIVKRQIEPLNFDPSFEASDESVPKQSIVPKIFDVETQNYLQKDVITSSMQSPPSPSNSSKTAQLTFTIDESSGAALDSSLKELDSLSDDSLATPFLPYKGIIEVTTEELRLEAGHLGDGQKQTELVEVQLKPQPLAPITLGSSKFMQHSNLAKDYQKQDPKVRDSNTITTYIPRTEIERNVEARNKTRHREKTDTELLSTTTTRVHRPQASEVLHAVSFSVTIKDRGGREVTKKSYEIGDGGWKDCDLKSHAAHSLKSNHLPSPGSAAPIPEDELSWSFQDGHNNQPEARSVHSFSSNASTNSSINPFASSGSFVILERGKSSAGYELPLEARTREVDYAPLDHTHVINSVRRNNISEDIELLPPLQYSLPLSPPQTPDPVEVFPSKNRPTPMNIVTYLPDNLKDINYTSQQPSKSESNERAGIEISSRLIPTTVSTLTKPLITKPENDNKALTQPTSETKSGVGYQSYIKDTLGKLFR